MLGRETAIQKVEWTPDGWLRMTTGDTLARLATPGLSGHVYPAYPERSSTAHDLRDEFDGPDLDLRLSTLRRPITEDWASLTARPGFLTLRGGEALTSRFDTALVATPLQDVDAIAQTRVQVEPRHYSHSAGLVVFYDDENFAYLRVYYSDHLASSAVGVVLVRGGHKEELVLDRVPVASGDVVLHVRIRQGTVQFAWREPQQEALSEIGPQLDATFMSDEATRGFTGTMVGLACVDAYRRDLHAAFDYLDLRHRPAT